LQSMGQAGSHLLHRSPIPNPSFYFQGEQVSRARYVPWMCGRVG
jgi:hypothetical protein